MKCCCFHSDLETEEPECYVVYDDGTVWAVYADCPLHPGGGAIEVAFSPFVEGHEMTAVVETAVALETLE